MKKILTTLSLIAGNVAVALAQVSGTINVGASQGQVNGGALLSLLALAQTLVARLVPFAIGLAVLAFFWFLIEFIWKGRDDAAAKTRSLSGMGYAVLALFVMVSIWGLVGFLGSILGVGQGGSVPVPGVPVPTQ
jgi:hypothetical protein